MVRFTVWEVDSQDLLKNTLLLLEILLIKASRLGLVRFLIQTDRLCICADIEDLVRDTGFQPSYTFEQGIAETVSWWKNQLTKGQVE